MKKHFKYILYFILTIVVLTTTSLILLTNQFFKFYNSYIEEEREEIGHQFLMVEWAITPLISNNDFKNLQTFCNSLKDTDIAVFIQDDTGKIIGASRDDINIKLFDLNTNDEEGLDSYITTLKTKMVLKKRLITIKNKKYLVKIALMQDNMITTFLRNQQNIIIAFLLSVITIILIFLYLIFDLKIPFDKLQESAKKIINGDFDSEIYVIEKGMLSEHSKTISNMAKQLKQKIHELKEIELKKNEMLAGISHEVKTPLTSIILASELLKSNEGLNKDGEDCVNIIDFNAKRLNNLILNIIDISKLEHQSITKQTEFIPINLEDCIYSVIHNSKILSNDIIINFEPEGLTPILGDSQLLETAILNILTNSIKYSKTDKIDVTINTKDKKVELRIKDYGIGIPEEHIDKVFDKFYRVDKNRSRELGGNGLGLSIVKEIITLHNGTISLLSNNGCEVIIELPLNIDDK